MIILQPSPASLMFISGPLRSHKSACNSLQLPPPSTPVNLRYLRPPSLSRCVSPSLRLSLSICIDYLLRFYFISHHVGVPLGQVPGGALEEDVHLGLRLCLGGDHLPTEQIGHWKRVEKGREEGKDKGTETCGGGRRKNDGGREGRREGGSNRKASNLRQRRAGSRKLNPLSNSKQCCDALPEVKLKKLFTHSRFVSLKRGPVKASAMRIDRI